MAYDPETDIDQGGDIEGHVAALDREDQYAQPQQQGIQTTTPAPAPERPSRPIRGLISPGNIDLNNRPVVHNEDGSISTVRSITIGGGENEPAFVLPTVIGGRVVSNEDAINYFKQTGQHLGQFDNLTNATTYAHRLHREQAQQYLPREPEQPAPTRYHPSQATPTSENITPLYSLHFQQPEVPPGTGKVTLSDYADQAWRGAMSMGSALTGAASFVAHQIDQDPQLRTWTDNWRDWMVNQSEATLKGMTPRAQEVLSASVLGYIPGAMSRDAQGNQIPTPGSVGWSAYLALNLTSMIPDGISMLIPASLAGRAAVWTAEALGAGKRMIQAAGAIGHAGGMGGYFGTEAAGTFYNNVVKQITGASDAELKEGSPVYAQLRQTKDINEAKADLVRQAAPLVLGAFAAGFVGGAGMGMFGRGVMRGAAGGAISMGAQGGATQALEQGEQKAIGLRKDYDLTSIMADTISQGVGGLVMGGIGGRFGHPAPKPGVDPDVGAAAAAATPPMLTGPEPQKLLTYEGPSQQQQALPAPTGTSINVPATGPGQIGVPSPLSFRDPTININTSPTTTQGQPPPGVPPEPPGAPPNVPPAPTGGGGGGAPVVPQGRAPAPTRQPAPTTQQTAPAATQGAAAPTRPLTRGEVPMAEWPSQRIAGGNVDQMRDELQSRFGYKPAVVSKMTDNAITTAYDQRVWAEEARRPTTVVTATGEAKAPGAAAPPVPGTSLPSAPEEAGPTTRIATKAEEEQTRSQAPTKTELTGQEPSPVRPEGGPASGVASQPQETTPKPTTKSGWEVERKKQEALVNTTWGGTSHQELGKALVARGVAPAIVEDMPRSARIERLNAMEERAGPTPTAPEARAAKRTRAKEQLAQPGPPVRGDVAEASMVRPDQIEAPEAEEDARVAQAREDRAGDLASAIQAIPAPRGSALEATLRKAQRYLSEAIGKTDGSRDAVAELIHNWMEGEPTKAYPGSNITARMLGEHLMQRVTGMRPAEREGIREEISEARREDVSREAGEPKVAPGEVETVAEKASEGAEGTSAVAVSEKKLEELPDTTDHRRTADNLIQKVMNGSMTPEEASDRYGKPQEGRGAKRRWPFLADRMRDWIKYAEDPKNQEKLIADMQKSQEATGLTPVQKRNEFIRIRKLLERVGPEAAATMREHLQRMEDRVGYAADQEATKAAEREHAISRTAELEGRKPLEQRAEPAGIRPSSSRYVRLAGDQRFGQFIPKILDDAHADGIPVSAKDLARHLMESPLLGEEMKPLQAIARQYFKLLPDDVRVYSENHAYDLGLIGQRELEDFQRGDVMGFYDPTPGRRHVVINTAGPRTELSFADTVLHELSHVLTADLIHHMWMTDPEHPYMQALRAIHNELATIAPSLSRADQLIVRRALGFGDDYAWAHELNTTLMTDARLQGITAERQASPELQRELTRLGFPFRRQGSSIFRAFTDWVRKALGLETPKSASEATLFDHIIRVPQEITEAATRFNEKELPKDPVLYQAARPLYQGVTQAMRESGRDALNALRREAPYLGSATLDRTRPATLAITNLDQMVPRYRETFEPSANVLMPAGNPLVRVRDAGERIAHRSKQFLDTFTDRSNELITATKSLKPAEQDRVAKLLNDATVANVHVAGANPHLTTPEQRAAETALKARFNALPAAQKEIEQKFVNLHGDIDKTERQAKVEGILNTVFPEATSAVRAAWNRMTSSKDRLEAFLANPDTSALAREYGAAWDDKYADLTKAVAKAVNTGWQRGDFVPLRRHGDYAVAYGERGTPFEGLELFDTRGQAEERYEELKRARTDHLRNVDFTRENSMREMTQNNPLIEQLNRALGRRPDLAAKADEIRDLMHKLVLEGMTRSDASRMRRRGIQGASLDFTRTLASEVRDTSARVGHLAHGGERMRALADMRLVADDLAAHGAPGQSREARQVISEIEKRVTNQENPGGASALFMRRASTFGYMQSLASLSHMATSTIENYSMAFPQIAARHGVGATTFELGRVGKSLIAPMLKTGGANMMRALGNKMKEKNWNVADIIGDHLKQAGFNGNHVNAVFGMLKRTGLIDHSYARELRRLANPEGLVSRTGRVVDYFNNLLSVWSHSVDAVNRANVAMTSFNLEFRKTGDAAKALVYAEERARGASPNYNLSNKNRFSTSAGPLGSWAGPIAQFKQYGFFAYGMLGTAAKQAFSKMPSEMRTEARYALAGMLATHAITAGVFSMIADPLRYIMGLYDFITGEQKPHDYQADLRGYLSEAVGPEIGQLIARGAIDTLLGTSVHRRVSFANMLEIPALESFDVAGVLKMAGTALVGASGDDAAKFATGMQAMGQGDFYTGIKAMIPRPIRDAMTAYDLATTGVKTQRGRLILPPEKITPYDVAVQALGFQPSRVSEAREGSAAVEQLRDEAKEEHTRLTQRWLQADPERRQEIWYAIQRFNDDPQHLGFRITMDQLRKDLATQHKRSQQPGAFGLTLPRKGAQQLIQAGSFANIQ